jgi:hypothetical protein
MSKNKTHWSLVDLTDGYNDIDPESPRGIAALSEYREHHAIQDVWLCSLKRLQEATDDEDPADFGPSVDWIDWSGFVDDPDWTRYSNWFTN